MKLVLHSYWRSSASHRVRIGLGLKQLPYEYVAINIVKGDQFADTYRAKNPSAQVPALEITDDDGARTTLSQSLAILEYLDERFASGAKLYPGDAGNRARVRRLIAETEAYLYREGISPIVDELFWSGDKGPDAHIVAKARGRLAEELEYMAKELKGKFLAGDTLTAADCVLAPCLQYCKRITVRKPETKLEDVIPPALREYGKRIESLPYFDKTYPPHWR